METSIERITAPNAEVRTLIAELEAELSAIYSVEQRHGLRLDELFVPHVCFFVAKEGSNAVGCGGVSFTDSTAEVKRMYVRPEARGRGVARAILGRLEDEARARDTYLLVLETGDAQGDAIRLYKRAGFRRCSPFGQYAMMPASAIRRSIFFEKDITRPLSSLGG